MYGAAFPILAVIWLAYAALAVGVVCHLLLPRLSWQQRTRRTPKRHLIS